MCAISANVRRNCFVSDVVMPAVLRGESPELVNYFGRHAPVMDAIRHRAAVPRIPDGTLARPALVAQYIRR